MKASVFSCKITKRMGAIPGIMFRAVICVVLVSAGWAGSRLFDANFNEKDRPVRGGLTGRSLEQHDENVQQCAECQKLRVKPSLPSVLPGHPVVDIEVSSNEMLQLDVINNDEGGLANKFSMAVGLTPVEEKEVERLILDYGDKLKFLQLEKMVQMEGAGGARFVIPPFAGEGEKLKSEFISKLRGSLGETVYSRLMACAADEIYGQMGNFGESRFEFSFQSDNGESVLNVQQGDVGADGKGSSRFIGSSIPSIYAHLFTFDEQKQ